VEPQLPSSSLHNLLVLDFVFTRNTTDTTTNPPINPSVHIPKPLTNDHHRDTPAHSFAPLSSQEPTDVAMHCGGRSSRQNAIDLLDPDQLTYQSSVATTLEPSAQVQCVRLRAAQPAPCSPPPTPPPPAVAQTTPDSPLHYHPIQARRDTETSEAKRPRPPSSNAPDSPLPEPGPVANNQPRPHIAQDLSTQCHMELAGSSHRPAAVDHRAQQRRGTPHPIRQPSALPPANIPYTGDYKGCVWNGQALFAYKTRKHQAKRDLTWKLFRQHDFTGVLETHGSQGTVDAATMPDNCIPFWTHGTTHQAGIGLLLKQEFLNKFNPVNPERDWNPIVPGRVGILSLQGSLGSLDIVVAYFATGQEGSSQQQNALWTISRHLRPRERVLTVMMGDWNFVTEDKDRFCKTHGGWTGMGDRSDQEEWMRQLGKPHSLHELQQPLYTCDMSDSRSRLDRVYTNHHTTDQLDRHFTCTALLWTPLSTHRPVSFARATPKRDPTASKPLASRLIQHPDWPRRVALEYQELLAGDALCDNPIRRLLLVKRAMHTVSQHMRQEGLIAQAAGADDKLGWTMSYIRAAESVNVHRMQCCACAYPQLADFINPSNPNARDHPNMHAVREHALELAKQTITEQITHLKQLDSDDPNHPHRQQQKEHILTQLKRTIPGSTTTLNAMRTPSGEITTDPTAIAATLQDHWSKVFKGKRIDGTALEAWLEALPHLKLQPTHSDPAAPYTSPATTAHNNIQGQPQRRRDQNQKVNNTPPRAGAHRPRLPIDAQSWKVTRKDISRSIDLSSDTAPGPDGIPYRAWRALGKLAVTVLYDVATALSTHDHAETLRQAYHDETPDDNHLYNLGTLICLPKKPAGHDEDAGVYYTPENTRPLSIVNTDNRLVANAARLHWEAMLSQWVSSNQQGFLHLRSILSNLLSLDTTAMHTALEGPNGALILFDFKAAFPSVSPHFLFKTLEHIGLPQNAIHLVRALYDNNHCNISYRGLTYPGFAMASGVRQGCPLSPLLYALVADALMEKICSVIPGIWIRAYADDTAIIATDFWTQAPTLAAIFEEFGQLSNLQLNYEKCVLIPLHPKGPEPPNAPPPSKKSRAPLPPNIGPTQTPATSRTSRPQPHSQKQLPQTSHTQTHKTTDPLHTLRLGLQYHLPLWSNMKLAWEGIYLGYMVGPGKGDRSWEKPAEKFKSRCAVWAGHGHGLQYNALTYNYFAISTLSYVAQLEMPPAWVLDEERAALRIAAPGPGEWASAEDLWHLHDAYGLARSFTSLQWLAQAAQLRVYTRDPATADKRQFEHQVARTRQLLSSSDMIYTRTTWNDWFSRSFAIRLSDNYRYFCKRFGSIAEILGENPLTITCHDSVQHRQQSLSRIQSAAYDALLHHDDYAPEMRIRYKQERWKLCSLEWHHNTILSGRQATPAWQARRTLHNLHILAALVTPRVCAAVFGTIWNRWVTHRRYQQRQSPTNVCVLGCSRRAEDSIEHYARCPCTAQLAAKYLRLHPVYDVNLHTFTLCNPHIVTQEDLAMSALMIYAVYRATNHYRHHNTPCAKEVQQALKQWVREGAVGHSFAMRTLDSRWSPTATHTDLPMTPARLPPTMPHRPPKQPRHPKR